MRLAIFSDVHGNVAALDAVLADIDQQHVVTTHPSGRRMLSVTFLSIAPFAYASTAMRQATVIARVVVFAFCVASVTSACDAPRTTAEEILRRMTPAGDTTPALSQTAAPAPVDRIRVGLRHALDRHRIPRLAEKGDEGFRYRVLVVAESASGVRHMHVQLRLARLKGLR